MQEVSRVRSIRLVNQSPNRKRDESQRENQLLPPLYSPGFIDGEGCFSVSFGKHRTLRRGIEVRVEFSIELRADDREILDRIRETIGCGKVFDCNYDRYGWYPHLKYKIGSVRELIERSFDSVY